MFSQLSQLFQLRKVKVLCSVLDTELKQTICLIQQRKLTFKDNQT